MTREDCYAIGFVLRTHGIRGGLTIQLEHDSPEEFTDLESVFVDIDSILVPFFVRSYKVRNTQSAIVEFLDVTEEAEAKELVGSQLYLPIPLASDDDAELPISALIGYSMVDSAQQLIGKIVGIAHIPGNDLFEIENGNREFLIPINEDWIVEIDNLSKLVEMDLPDGLLSLDDESESD
jgi:16S rRNA processing protein RimM